MFEKSSILAACCAFHTAFRWHRSAEVLRRLSDKPPSGPDEKGSCQICGLLYKAAIVRSLPPIHTAIVRLPIGFVG
jgi:hypothetical protein